MGTPYCINTCKPLVFLSLHCVPLAFHLSIRFGVRPLPKRQMVMKLKEIYQYTHQLLSSDSEEEVLGQHQDPSAAHLKHRPEPASASASRDSKQPVGVAVKARAEVPALRQDGHEDGQLHQEPLSASQASTASSTAASEDSER